jgi:RimJ/RimL family protein N-acetyltransferase
MQLAEFIDTHVPALERDEVRHNLILGVLARAAHDPSLPLLTWTLGGPGACAIKTPGRPIILGEVDRGQCRALAEATLAMGSEGVVGVDVAPRWFVERAVELGQTFRDPIPQRIHALREKPTYPDARGGARLVRLQDAPRFVDWFLAFAREAVPEDPAPVPADLQKVPAQERHLFWVLDDEPVSMAGIARQLRSVAAIAPVYTPPAQRGRGFAGSVTAAVVERIFAEGKTAACLYTDLRNAASNRCYARIGFRPVCDAWVYRRLVP